MCLNGKCPGWTNFIIGDNPVQNIRTRPVPKVGNPLPRRQFGHEDCKEGNYFWQSHKTNVHVPCTNWKKGLGTCFLGRTLFRWRCFFTWMACMHTKHRPVILRGQLCMSTQNFPPPQLLRCQRMIFQAQTGSRPSKPGQNGHCLALDHWFLSGVPQDSDTEYEIFPHQESNPPEKLTAQLSLRN